MTTPPASAQPARDWELDCDHCNGSGHVFVKHQVAERETDVQEFKEECERCEGRGFSIAFQDIPGIAEYVKSCRSASAQDDAKDDQAAFEEWLARTCPSGDVEAVQHQWEASSEYEDFHAAAPAAGDARDAARYRTVRKSIADEGNGANQVAAASEAIGLERGSYPTADQFDEIVDHIAAQQSSQGEK